MAPRVRGFISAAKLWVEMPQKPSSSQLDDTFERPPFRVIFFTYVGYAILALFGILAELIRKFDFISKTKPCLADPLEKVNYPQILVHTFFNQRSKVRVQC